MSLLEVEGIRRALRRFPMWLFGVSLRVEEREVVALLGRNGAGKKRRLRTLMGVLSPAPVRSASPGGRSTPRAGPDRPRRMQLVPEERAVFGGLTVEENLRVPSSPPTGPGRSTGSGRSSRG